VITVVPPWIGSDDWARPGQLRPITGSTRAGRERDRRGHAAVRSLYLILLVQLEALIAAIGFKREPYGAMVG
jgi:hypothetical protein